MNTYDLTPALVMPNAFTYAGVACDVHVYEDDTSSDASWTLEASHVGHANDGNVYPTSFALIEAMGYIESNLDALDVHGDDLGELVTALIATVRNLITVGTFGGN